MTEQPAKAPRKPKLPTEDVLHPPPFDKQDMEAIQALAAGTANEGQQKRALDWIVYYAAGTYDMPYRSERSYDTAFACGRMFVGQRIAALLRMKPGSMET